MELDIRQHLAKAKEQGDSGALQSAYQLIKSAAAAAGRGRAPRVPAELHVICAEAALQLGFLEISAACLKTYFEGAPPANQFLCRAYLCRGRLRSPPATGTLEDFEEAVRDFLKAIELSKQEARNHPLVFDASVLYYQAARPLLRPGRSLHLVPSLRQVVRSLEEVADPDHSWRAELMISAGSDIRDDLLLHLVRCLVDSGEHEEAASFAKVTEDFIKSNIPHLYPRLFTLLVEHKLSASDVLLEASRQSTELAVAYKVQQFKNRLGIINKKKLTEEDAGQLEEIFHFLVDQAEAGNNLQCPSPIQPSDRVALLLELALLALQVKHQKVAGDCLKELKSAGGASVDQRMLMECVNCEINLLKKEAKTNDYSKGSVEARLKEIGKLDQRLQTAAASGGTPRAAQAVCAALWSACLPLLQRNLRTRVKAPLLRVAQALEEMQSTHLEMRCRVHSELAVIEEEEGRLDASVTHLQKALLLDDGGALRERLSSALRLAQLRQTLHQAPSRTEDKAALLMQQARDKKSQDKTDGRPVLVAVGLLLAPDDFQMVLDADDTSQSTSGCGPAAQLAARAQHHTASVQKVNGHLARQGGDTDGTERVNLWATLAKTARKLEVWDVCRAACRFCLLYDDGRWKLSKSDKCGCLEGEHCAECLPGRSGTQSCVQLLRLIAEIHIISAEATIQKLLAEGLQLNSPPVLPVDKHVSEEDSDWVIYRDWIAALSAHATCSFLRAGELGAQIKEPWAVANAAVYLWNYNSHVLAAGEYQRLLPTFQKVVEMLQKTEYTGSRALFVLLCDAVARGLIQPLCGPGSTEATAPAAAADKGKHRAEKGVEKAASGHGALLDPAALQDVRRALEMCEHALRMSSCHVPGESVHIAARKQVLATWVQVKRLLQQQIGSKLDTPRDESETQQVSAMTRVLVGVEMLRCNRDPGHMEFSAPGLSTLVSMASECSWCDAAVELQVWCQLAAFCHHVKDRGSVLSCTRRALQLEEAAARSLKGAACALYSLNAVNELLSTAACLRGLTLAHESRGSLQAYREAVEVLVSSVSFSEKADNPALCITAARHYWNACLPLTQSAEGRQQLQEHLERILNTLVQTTKQKNKPGKARGSASSTQQPLGSAKRKATNEEDSALKAAMYSLLFHIHIDKADFAGAVKVLDKALTDLSRSKHRLALLKYRVLVKARRGESVELDVQKFKDEGEQGCSGMWRQVARCPGTVTQQLPCYRNAITSLTSLDSGWQKVDILLEFGEWLYCHNFDREDARLQVEWAVDVLLRLEPKGAEGAEGASEKRRLSMEGCESLPGVHSSTFPQNVSTLNEVCRLYYLIQAHTLLAVMAGRASPEHQLHLLRAYTFVLQIWQVSISVAAEISSDVAKSQTLQPPPSAESKKGKDKGKAKKVKDPTPADERPRPVILDLAPPSGPREWARYVCPDQARQIFRSSSSPHCINAHSITKQTQSLFFLDLLEKELHSLSLDHLTLPVMHLAETIAHDLLDRRSLSHLYRLRIVRTCFALGLETLSPYEEKLVTLSAVQEEEQMRCRTATALSQQKGKHDRGSNQKTEVDEKPGCWPGGPLVSAQHIWLDKAEVCLSMGLHQSARQLLAEALMVSEELGDEPSVSRSLLGLARLACEEQNFAQAVVLLDKAQVLGGDEEFWHQLTLAKTTAVIGQRSRDSLTKVDEIVKRGCGALKLILEQRANRVTELTFLITSLEKRGAVESIQSVVGGGEPGETLSTEALWRLMAASASLKECATAFTKLNYKEQAAESHAECAQALRLLASHSTDSEEKQRFLLDGLQRMQLAVAAQEHVALNAARLLPSQVESAGPSLAAVRRLRRLRLALVEFCLAVLEERCGQEARQAAARQKKTAAEIALEEFTRCTPEPDSTEQEWASVGRTLGQVALGHLTAANSQCPDDAEARAHCLSLMGKYLRLSALQEEPDIADALWDGRQQREARTDPPAVFSEEQTLEEESGGKGPGMTSGKSAELQMRRSVQQLMAEASQTLAEAVSLCLQHNLSSTLLADASFNMLECHGHSDPAVTGQYLALFQSCCTVATAAQVLGSACTDTRTSRLAALLALRRKPLLSHEEERPGSMLKGAENSLAGLSKAFSHLTVSPNHLGILSELPPNLKILLLQHSVDGSHLYGAFYEPSKPPENLKGRTAHVSGNLACSSAAKVPVCPRALLALRKRSRAFGQETGRADLTTEPRHGAEGGQEASEEQQETAGEKFPPCFAEIVQDMEDYLTPVLTQLDFSSLRPAAASLSAAEMAKTRDKEEKGSVGEVRSPAEPEEYLVILADRMLQELPLESLSVLQEDGLSSVSRDFSLQLFYSRLSREETHKVESDNKKETKGGKGTKAKGDQSLAIKAVTANHTPPPNTIPVDSRNIKYLIYPHGEGGTSLTTMMKEISGTHYQHLTHLWEAFKQTPSLSEAEQVLCRCSAFIYVGVEHFLATVPPAKLAAFNLSECRMALLFDRTRRDARSPRHSDGDTQRSAALEKPSETALLLSLGGVGCVVLNQWPCSLQQNTRNMATVIDTLLSGRQTCGQTLHALRKGGKVEKRRHTLTDQLAHTDSVEEEVQHRLTPSPSASSCILYGLPHLIVM